MNHVPPTPDLNEVEETTPVYAKTDMTAVVEIIQSIVQDNKKGVAELTRLHRNMYNGIIQKQNDELENYRRGALRQSMVHVLRSVAEIYNENNQDFEAVENPVSLLKYVMSQLKELLQDNDVLIVQSKPETHFDRKFMKTQERHTVTTDDPTKDRTVVESIKPGYMFFGEPLLQELVSVWKYTSNSDAPTSDAKSNDETNCVDSEENITPTLVSTNQRADVSDTSSESTIEQDEASVLSNDALSEDKLLNESEDVNHA